jgi:hypothetical protein
MFQMLIDFLTGNVPSPEHPERTVVNPLWIMEQSSSLHESCGNTSSSSLHESFGGMSFSQVETPSIPTDFGSSFNIGGGFL